MLNIIKQLLGLPTANPLDAELLAKGTVIDVRTPAEFAAGHAPGSTNIPVDQIGASIAKIKKMPQPIITCCKSGMRSGMAKKVLEKSGVEAINGGTWRAVAAAQQK